MFGNTLIVIAMICLVLSVIIIINEGIKFLRDRRYKVKWKLPILFFIIYVVLYILAVILLNL
ncbi:Uncharacterised protein [Mammaliicoccus lentus]|uniref:hypothetical protein n=1 Tax=Mammaliicoccus lentus TaxID=42858 RepID=UPI00085C9621|nr:hypothetical protein [Mammaliicoccus lentus]SCU43965.1 Uncharacterised protein [Mammaliicoccus lentus]